MKILHQNRVATSCTTDHNPIHPQPCGDFGIFWKCFVNMWTVSGRPHEVGITGTRPTECRRSRKASALAQPLSSATRAEDRQRDRCVGDDYPMPTQCTDVRWEKGKNTGQRNRSRGTKTGTRAQTKTQTQTQTQTQHNTSCVSEL